MIRYKDGHLEQLKRALITKDGLTEPEAQTVIDAAMVITSALGDCLANVRREYPEHVANQVIATSYSFILGVIQSNLTVTEDET